MKKALAFSIQLCYYIRAVRNARLAQLDRASGYGPEGQGFESLIACQHKTVDLKIIGGFWYF